MRNSTRARTLLLVIVAILLVLSVVGLSVEVLPGPPVGPTATYPEGIDFPDERPIPRR